MTNRIMALLKVQLLQFIGFNEILHTKDRKRRASLVFLALSMIFIGVVMAIYSAIVSHMLFVMGLTKAILGLMVTVTSLIILFFTMLKTNGTLFALKDHDILMSLPLKTEHIISSKMLWMYLSDLLFIAVVMIPAGIVYGLYTGAGFLFYIMFILSLFFIPLVPMFGAILLGVLVAGLANRFKYKNAVTILISFALVLAALYLSMTLNRTNMADMTVYTTELMRHVYHIYPIALLYTKALGDQHVISFFAFLLLSVVWAFLFLKFIAWKYVSINHALTARHINHTFHLQNLKTSSPLLALYKKELKRLFSSANYVLNTGMGMFLLLVITLYFALTGFKQFDAFTGTFILDIIGKLLPLFIALLVALSCTTASAISLEGKNLWILTSAPVTSKTIFNSKIAVNLTLHWPIIFICATVIAIYLPLTLASKIFIFITPLVFSLFVSVIGIFINLKLPNFNWTSEVTVIKQSTATLIAMIINMASVLVSLILLFILPLPHEYSLACITIVVAIITGILYRLMVKINLQYDS